MVRFGEKGRGDPTFLFSNPSNVLLSPGLISGRYSAVFFSSALLNINSCTSSKKCCKSVVLNEIYIINADVPMRLNLIHYQFPEKVVAVTLSTTAKNPFGHRGKLSAKTQRPMRKKFNFINMVLLGGLFYVAYVLSLIVFRLL